MEGVSKVREAHGQVQGQKEAEAATEVAKKEPNQDEQPEADGSVAWPYAASDAGSGSHFPWGLGRKRRRW